MVAVAVATAFLQPLSVASAAAGLPSGERSAGKASAETKGDINGDGQVDVLDVQLCVNVFLSMEKDPAIVQGADVNQDGVVNVLDVQGIVNTFLAPPATPTATGTATLTQTQEPTATETNLPTETITPTSTDTDFPPTIVPSNTPTALPPSATAAPTQAPSETATSAPTDTPTSTVTNAVPSPTETPDSSPTSSPDTFVLWSKVEIDFHGPSSIGMSSSANPFQIPTEVEFTSPGGQTFLVPAFYDGDGSGGLDGDVWRVRFSPDSVGLWSYASSSSEPLLDGNTGSFEVIAPSGCGSYVAGGLPDFGCVGRLEYVGDHYLKLANGPYWLKGGADDPEDFLGPGITVGFPTKEEAIGFLADNKINSMYIMLQNIDGDGRNVWPWVGSSQAEAKTNHEHFDIGKLAEWEQLFSYIQSKGLVLHFVLEDDSGWTGFNRSMYYREMVARFGHYNGLIWNIAEEYQENYSPNEVKSFAQMLRDLDPYDHPVTVHHAGGTSAWNPFLGDSRFDLTSFQSTKTAQNATADSWFQAVESSGRTIPISFDETGKLSSSDRELARQILWSVYLGGGMFEMHTFPLSQYQDFAPHFEDLGRARAFIEQLPYWQMRPTNNILVSGNAYVFAKAGEMYLIYLPSGGTLELNLSAASGTLQAVWFEPSTGDYSGTSAVSGGGILPFTSPFSSDAVLLISK